MSIIYNELAYVYHEMYQSIFNYKEEYDFYRSVLKEYGAESLVEIGCGSGNLAKYFEEDGYEYQGVDYSKEMLAIAKKNNRNIKFIQQDMRELELDKQVDAVIISGRSYTYMTKNIDGMKCLNSIYNNLKDGGILIFDNFRAEFIFNNFQDEFVQECRYENKLYKRMTTTSKTLEYGWTWELKEKYSVKIDGEEKELGEDISTVRAFTEDEINLLLQLNNFELLKSIDEKFRLISIAKKL